MPYDPNLAISRNVRAAMARKKTTQTQVAQLLGVTQASISYRLSGKTRWPAAELVAVARFLDVPLSSLADPTATKAAS